MLTKTVEVQITAEELIREFLWWDSAQQVYFVHELAKVTAKWDSPTKDLLLGLINYSSRGTSNDN